MKAGVALTDVMTGRYATVAVLTALAHRANTGLGQHIDLAQLDLQVACLANQTTNDPVDDIVPAPIGNALPTSCPTKTSLPPMVT